MNRDWDSFLMKVGQAVVCLLIALAIFIFPGAALADTGTVTGTKVNVRGGPGTTYPITGSLDAGAQVAVLETNQGWFRVIDAKVSGWVSGSYLAVQQEETIHISGQLVNLRSGPGTSYNVVGQAGKGDTLWLVANNGDWLQVRNLAGLECYVSSSLIERSNSPATANPASIPSTAPTSTTVPGGRQLQSRDGLINVRKGPGVDYDKVGMIDDAHWYPVLAADGDWYQIALTGGTTAYVASWLVNLSDGQSTSDANLNSSSPASVNQIKVFLDGQQLSFDVPPIIEDGRTLVPLRQIFESMGAQVDWLESTSTVKATRGSTTILLQIGSTNPTVNGQLWPLDVPAKIVQGRTLAPLRFVGEAFGGLVAWDDATRTIQITSPVAAAPSAPQQPSAAPEAAVIVQNDTVNLRTGPGTVYDKIDTVSAGETLPILAQKDGWFQVSRGGSVAWIAGWLVAMAGNSGQSAVGDEQLVWYYSSKDQDGFKINIESGSRLGSRIDKEQNTLTYTIYGRSLKGNNQLSVLMGSENLVVTGENRDNNAVITITLPAGIQYETVTENDGKRSSIVISNHIVQVSRKAFGNIGDNIIIYTLTPCEFKYEQKGDILEVKLYSTAMGLDRSSYDYEISPLLKRMTINQTQDDPPQTTLRIETSNMGDYRVFQTSDDNALNIVLTTQKRQSSNNRLVILDPGHGGRDPGARGSVLQEKDVNLDIALKVGKILSSRKIDVAYTRDSDQYVTLDDRCNIANQMNAAVFVSIHNNANTAPEKEGTETYYYAPFDQPELFMQKDERSRLAALIQTNMSQALKRVDRGVKQSNFAVIRGTNMPSSLVECVFISNPTEEQLLQDDAFRRKAAEAIAEAIIEFLNSR